MMRLFARPKEPVASAPGSGTLAQALARGALVPAAAPAWCSTRAGARAASRLKQPDRLRRPRTRRVLSSRPVQRGPAAVSGSAWNWGCA
ncbi:hypothetical protein LP419_01755 [Massilia sp. H-1]|nr:hypothetical protein LP419_01755 [Massilia sp. H-1]